MAKADKKVGYTSSNTQNIRSRIKEIIPEYKGLWLYLKYCPELLSKDIKTFDELKETYKMFPQGVSEQDAELYLLEEPVQQALKVLLNAMHEKKMVELYNIYFEKAKNDVQAFKAFVEFSNTFFNNKGESELTAILKGIDIGDE